ncbi:MAG: hypothetical protein WDZ46_03315 [Solirubrobacterales bacterium]
MAGARLGLLPFLLGASFLALGGQAVAASPHIKIREVYPGSTSAPLAEYVQLQTIAPQQNDVEGQVLEFYDADGMLASSFTLPGDVVNGESQRTILLANPEAAAAGASSPDFTMPSIDRMSPAGGAVCFTGAGPDSADCLSWGSVPLLKSPFPDPQRVNAPAIADGTALRRTIARPCSTFLDPADDSANSNSDFFEAAPLPQNNAAPVSGSPCIPNSFITTFPLNPTRETSATFTYTESPQDPVARFECAFDWAEPLGEADFASCPVAGSISFADLEDGLHHLAVRAIGQGGTDPSPDLHTWMVDTVAPQTTIESAPPNPSWGLAVSFSFRSSEPDSGFHCQLDSGAIQVCAEPDKSYFLLPDGVHTVRVWATDNAGNKDGTPAEHTFLVDNRIGDLVAPDTHLLSGPPNPSSSSTAAFAYSATEPGSTFECRLGAGAFQPCAAGGSRYDRLRNGLHTFQVRSIDPAGNVDSIPASHQWRVAAPAPNTRFRRVPPGRLSAGRGRTAAAVFHFASEPGATFRCRLNLKGSFKPCRSPHRFRAPAGRHIFQVTAVDRIGNVESTPAFRIFRVQAPGRHRPAFVQSGRFLSSLTSWISPAALPRRKHRPVTLRFASAFENLDGTDIPAPRVMTMRLAKGGIVQWKGLPRCTNQRLRQRSSAEALAVCRRALVGRGVVHTALRFPEGDRIRSRARLLLFNAGRKVLMHIHVTKPLHGVFVVPIEIGRGHGAFGTVLRTRFPRVVADYGHVTGFQMELHRTYRHRGKRRSYLMARCPAPPGFNRVAFELARVEYRFRGGLRLENSTVNVCHVRD